jgi:hypothetical protein
MNLNTFVSRLQPKHWRNLARMFRNHQWEANDDGEILIGHARISGAYETLAPDGLGSVVTRNLLTTEGINHLLTACVGNGVQVGTWYVAPFSGNVTIADTLTAATFASATTELTTQYSEASRVTYQESVPANKSTSNTENPAVFTSAAGNVNIWGIGLLSVSTKGSTSGVLLSAAKYSTVRNLPVTGDQLSVKYTLSLANS